MILVRASGAGIKREGLILWEIRHRRPRIWNKRRIRNRKGKAALPCPCMNREACCLQLGQLTGANWNHPLASGFTRERRLLHPATALRHSTNELLTELKLNLDLERKKKGGIGNPMYFNRRVFLHTCPLACCSKYSQIYLFPQSAGSICECLSPGFTCTLICQLICWSAYRQTHPKMNVPANFDATWYVNLPVHLQTRLYTHRSCSSWSFLSG